MNIKILFLKYLFYFSLIFLFVIYLLPGNLIEFNEGIVKEKTLLEGSIKHFYYFSYLTTVGLFVYIKEDKFYALILILLFLSLTIEFLHLFIPLREFSYYDVLANVLGYLFGLLLITFIKKYITK
jgi:hypothetical protein